MMKLYKAIPIILLLFPSSLTYPQSNALLKINDLSSVDKNFTLFKEKIASNNQKWDQIKDDYKDSKASFIKPLAVATYIVKNDETIFSIAEKFGLNSDTIISFNSLANDLSARNGTRLFIPSMNGIVAFPNMKTTTTRISNIYNISEALLLYINGMKSGSILAKEEVFIPFARLSDEEKAYFIASPFLYPLQNGQFSSHYGKRFHPILRRWVFHGGVDIAVPNKSNVFASAEGKVIHVGWAGGYGILVVVQHKYGYTTWYGHLNKINVSLGDYVSQRQLIAYSGNTGRSTGPHLHFEVRRFNLRENPLEVLTFNHESVPFKPKK